MVQDLSGTRYAAEIVVCQTVEVDLRGPVWYIESMTIKELALKTIAQLPEDASWADIQERINFIAGVRKGLTELDRGEGIGHDRVREEFAQWLTS